VSQSNLWIPVIGTLGGAIVGFATSFVTAWWNAGKAEDKASQDRKRSNLEELYRTFINLRMEGYGRVGKCLNKVNHNVAFEEKTYTDIAPNSKAEMLIKLYARELNESWEIYVKAKDDFGKICVKILMNQFDHLPKQEQQNITEQVLAKHKAYESSISDMHNKISEIIEP
jgi:hypothetical protein